MLFLPRKQPQKFRKEQIIYAPEDHADSIFLVVRGAVKLSRIAESGRETVLDLLGADEFFGESAMRRQEVRGESAMAVGDVAVMEWKLDELSDIMLRVPSFGWRIAAGDGRQDEQAGAHIESMAIDPIVQRLIKALLATRRGVRRAGGRGRRFT